MEDSTYDVDNKFMWGVIRKIKGAKSCEGRLGREFQRNSGRISGFRILAGQNLPE
jgi:hypothetical protein